MAPKTERIQFLRAVRQLHRVRSFYTAGVLLWAASTAWTDWQTPGSRQMRVSALLVTAACPFDVSQFPQRAASHKAAHTCHAHA
ncbi:hypothetical protein [Streptomyces sp. NPDC017958]|uniref:hypothetical protein n=1 Tax=Streptomyces sp. NPDC017958 TaxID=3365021 RepID=UPI0037A61DE9